MPLAKPPVPCRLQLLEFVGARRTASGPSRVRVLGVDLGTKRIGIASADTRSGLASALTVLERRGNHRDDHRRIAELVAEEEATVVVVGLPIDLAGKVGIAARGVLAEVQELATVMGVPVETYDERMTSAAAHKNLQAIGLTSRQRRSQIDKHAAAVMLQGWLDANAGRPS